MTETRAIEVDAYIEARLQSSQRVSVQDLVDDVGLRFREACDVVARWNRNRRLARQASLAPGVVMGR
jgi:hypothetical protein